MEKKIVRTTAPLTREHVRMFFEDQKNIEFEIDYAESKIKLMPLLTFIANLNLPCRFYFDETKITKEERFELIKAYMTSKTIVSDKTLAHSVANILLTACGVPEYNVVDTTLIKASECQDFIKDNVDLLFTWKVFLDSLPLFIIHSYEATHEAVNVKEGLTVIDDSDYVGRNVVNLIDVEGFLIYYMANPIKRHPAWLEKQFEQPIYNSNTLFHYFENISEDDDTALSNLIKLIVSGAVNELLDLDKMLESEGKDNDPSIQESLS